MTLRLFHYWRSSSSWRVRWALEIKKIPVEFTAINLLTDESDSPDHLARNPMGYVPALQMSSKDQGDRFLAESVAIIEWLEETYPSPSLFPKDPFSRAQCRQLAEIINSGTQPLQNLTASEKHSQDREAQKEWNQFWIRKGFTAYEQLAKETAKTFSFGEKITYPDLFLVPQCYNALRNQIQLEDFPLVHRIYQNCLQTPECQASSPEQFQPKN